MGHKIDEKDRMIINILRKNARISYADIAKKMGMKSPSVIERIKRLENEGIISDYNISVDYKALGYDILAFIGVYIDNAEHIEEFENTLNTQLEEVVGCHHVTGEYTMILKVATKNTETLSDMIKKLRDMPGVTKTNTMIVFSTIVERSRPV
ncbi:Lrp/AsnC family transcriptional regulator [Limisalsivibrio acetivorans]|uniref:Lrp/AsnC family transcriptional regulator n=1 Tax=Limisalsivibrio acetivorans TaxID=1304888 RepID=UPI0003B38856|nr:Lrp/AsnC family transcriptional regulator [Limisalsivibrio acetivorans]